MKEGSPRQSWLIINPFPVKFQRKASRGLLSTIFGATVLALSSSFLKPFAQKRTDPAIPICSHLFSSKYSCVSAFVTKERRNNREQPGEGWNSDSSSGQQPDPEPNVNHLDNYLSPKVKH